MTSVAELAAEVHRAVEGHPYTVVDVTDDGFTVQLDLADARWWGLLSRSGVRRTWRWQVRVRPDDAAYSTTDIATSLEWQAGLLGPDGQPRPRFSTTASTFRGTAWTRSFRSTWAVGDDGRFREVVRYSFDSGEGRAIIDTVLQRHGLRKTMNTPARIGLAVALLAGVGTALGGVVALVLALTDNLP